MTLLKNDSVFKMTKKIKYTALAAIPLFVGTSFVIMYIIGAILLIIQVDNLHDALVVFPAWAFVGIIAFVYVIPGIYEMFVDFLEEAGWISQKASDDQV